jgi:hypothetical protein
MRLFPNHAGSGGRTTLRPHAFLSSAPNQEVEFQASGSLLPDQRQRCHIRMRVYEGETATLFRTVPAGSTLSFDVTPKHAPNGLSAGSGGRLK